MSFKSTPFLTGIKSAIENASSTQKQEILKANAIFQFEINNSQGEQATWTMDLKNGGRVTQGKSETIKPDITVSLADNTFVDLASGKTTGQKAFMAGKIKVKGNMMLATRLDAILKLAPANPPTTEASGKSSNTGTLQVIEGVGSSRVFQKIHASLMSMSAQERSDLVKKSKAVFQFNIKSKLDNPTAITLDLKNGNGDVYVGQCKTGKPEITITIADKDFVDLAGGKLNGQKAFMSGKLKIQGNMMLATKLDATLKQIQKSPKL